MRHSINQLTFKRHSSDISDWIFSDLQIIAFEYFSDVCVMFVIYKIIASSHHYIKFTKLTLCFIFQNNSMIDTFFRLRVMKIIYKTVTIFRR